MLDDVGHVARMNSCHVLEQLGGGTADEHLTDRAHDLAHVLGRVSDADFGPFRHA
jgi:hypothetical protein